MTATRTASYPPPPATILRRWWPLVVWAVATVAGAVWVVADAFHEREEELRRAEIRIQSATAMTAEHVLRVIEGADTAVKATRPLYRALPDWERLSADAESWRRLRDMGEALSAVTTMFMADSQGLIRLHAQSFPLVPVPIADRRYFQWQRDAGGDNPYLSDPVVGRVIGRPSLILSRRLTLPDGSFAGLVGANIDPRTIHEHFATMIPGEEGVVVLLRDDNTILARYPDKEGTSGATMDLGRAFPAMAGNSASTTALTLPPFDDIRRVASFTRLERYGLVVLTAVPVDTVLEPWRQQTNRMAMVVGIGALLLTTAFILLLSRYHTEAETRTRLKESEATLNRAQAVAHIGSWQMELPERRRRWSDETYRIFGWEPGRPLDSAAIGDRIHPDDRDKAMAAMEHAIAGHPLDVEYRLMVDGAVKWVALRAEVTFSPTGQPVEILGTTQDITDKKRAETAMAESRALLLEVQSVANLGYYVYDIPSDRWTSSAILDTIFGIDDSHDRTGAGWLALVAPSMRAEMTRYIAEIRSGAHDFNTDYLIVRPSDGAERWVAGLGKIERDASGAVTRMVGTIKDITEQRRAEQALRDKAEELARSNTELEQFAYVASHDLREPLRMVSSYVGLLERRYADKLDDEAREFIAFAKDGATRMDSLVLDLLEYSRIGRITRPMLPVPLGLAVERAIRSLAPKIVEAGAEIVIPPDILPTVLGDAEELTRLFQNVIGNAVKYRAADRSPVITLAAERHGRMWTVTVRDNGIGIDPQYFERIFLIFQRLHKRGDYEGTGIGLSICKKIVEHHGGRIWVESASGQGSSFSFTLPGVE